MEVGIRIKNYLKERGISQKHISNRTKIPAPKLNLALNGKRRLSFDEYTLICEVLELETDYFLKKRLPTNATGPM